MSGWVPPSLMSVGDSVTGASLVGLVSELDLVRSWSTGDGLVWLE